MIHPGEAETISQRALEELYGGKITPKLEWLLIGDRLFHRIGSGTWVEYPPRS